MSEEELKWVSRRNFLLGKVGEWGPDRLKGKVEMVEKIQADLQDQSITVTFWKKKASFS